MAVFLAKTSTPDYTRTSRSLAWKTTVCQGKPAHWAYTNALRFHREATAAYLSLTGWKWVSPTAEKKSYLARYLEATASLSPETRMQGWNESYPDWGYSDSAKFQKASTAAHKAISGKKSWPLRQVQADTRRALSNGSG